MTLRLALFMAGVAFLMQVAWADLYKVNCEVDSKSAEVMLLRTDPEDSDKIKSGVYFYAENARKNLIFAVMRSDNKDLVMDSSSDVLRQGLKRIFSQGDLKVIDVSLVRFPESSILLVGNVGKHNFIKVAANETIADLKKRVDPLMALGNSLTFRGKGFVGNNYQNVLSRSVLPGDVVIAPIRTPFALGENMYYFKD